jgi:hypothetical protein
MWVEEAEAFMKINMENNNVSMIKPSVLNFIPFLVPDPFWAPVIVYHQF